MALSDFELTQLQLYFDELLDGMTQDESGKVIDGLEKVVEAIDRGASTNEIKHIFTKYIQCRRREKEINKQGEGYT